MMVATLLSVAACRKESADAYGNFEATEVTVSAEASGRVLRLDVEEGARLAAAADVGLIDTTTLALQRAELLARRAAAQARVREVDANAATLETQRVIAERELARTRRLLAQQAATAQQGDRAERDAKVLGDQLQGAAATRSTVGKEVASIDAQVASIDERLRRSRVVAPGGGTVLARYVEPGEFVQLGTPLFKMAALDTLTLRAYLSGAQLAQVALGQSLTVRVDAGGDSLRTVQGRVTWIAATAEFTPTPIQTREERTVQVYAVKLAVPNVDGRLRIGMPAEVTLAAAAPASGASK
ncbi:MAG: HlyD family efflux transporter periplasmic adaptor subunit [Gemmatimonadaceae bacterium]|nr:HlyD family efflux transporter periplasmic adaptor subunit [Gemmatimonadota bacterium]MBK8646731.1 HlyD family efflux transporter periplasmic adaptor subunit [Gemmatimonadota bacterium]MCC7322844.1 HlyD family efflux transporter periplasmic adaptor subunit [Gemmatimonadaceae bacterium]